MFARGYQLLWASRLKILQPHHGIPVEHEKGGLVNQSALATHSTMPMLFWGLLRFLGFLVLWPSANSRVGTAQAGENLLMHCQV